MAHVLSKEYTCLSCHKPIKISKIDNAGPGAKKKWEKYEPDGVTPHQCKKQESEVVAAVVSSKDLDHIETTKEIAAVKAQLLVLAGKLERIEKELKG